MSNLNAIAELLANAGVPVNVPTATPAPAPKVQSDKPAPKPVLNDDGTKYTAEDEERDRQLTIAELTAICDEREFSEEDVTINIVGRYIWAKGEMTKEIKWWFKQDDYQCNNGRWWWASQKEVWMWKPKNASSKKWGKRTEEEKTTTIVSRYGVTSVRGGVAQYGRIEEEE